MLNTDIYIEFMEMLDSLGDCKALNKQALCKDLKSHFFTALNAFNLKHGDIVYVANTFDEMVKKIFSDTKPVTLEEVLDESNGKCFVVDGMRYTYACLVSRSCPDRVCTNKELAMWLAKGYGEYKYNDNVDIPDIALKNMSTTDYHREPVNEDEPVSNIMIRKWGDFTWHEPTLNYMTL